MISLYEPLKKVGNLGLRLAFAANGWDGVAWDARQVRQAHAAAANCYLPVGGFGYSLHCSSFYWFNHIYDEDAKR